MTTIQHGPVRYYGYAKQVDPHISLLNMTGLPDALLPDDTADDPEFQHRWAIGELVLEQRKIFHLHDYSMSVPISQWPADIDRHTYFEWLTRFALRQSGWHELFSDDEYANALEGGVQPSMFVPDHLRGPDLVEADGTQVWMLAGCKHRDHDLPAVMRPDGTIEWWWKGLRDRPLAGIGRSDDLPDDDGHWQLATVLRDPAVGPNEYHVDGQLHRTEGPAIEHPSSMSHLDEYWVEGRQLGHHDWWPLSDECRAAEDWADRFC